MKRLLSLLTIFLFALAVQAQTTTNNLSIQQPPGSLQLKWVDVAVDSGATLWSQDFRITEYDADSFSTYPVNYYVKADSGTAGDSINCAIYRYVNFIHPDSTSDWFVADTLISFTVDPTSKDTSFIGTSDFNNVKAPYEKIKVVNGYEDFVLSFGLYFARKE